MKFVPLMLKEEQCSHYFPIWKFKDIPGMWEEYVQQLQGIKKSTIDAILTDREKVTGPFQSLEDFLHRIAIHPSDAAILTKSGTLDSISDGLNRPQILWFIEAWLNRVPPYPKTENRQVQASAFKNAPLLPPTSSRFSNGQKWAHEWETLGFYLSVHPLDLAEPFFRSVRQTIVPASDFAAHSGKKIWVKGWPVTRKEVLTHEGEEMEFFTFEDKPAFLRPSFSPNLFGVFARTLTWPCLFASGRGPERI